MRILAIVFSAMSVFALTGTCIAADLGDVGEFTSWSAMAHAAQAGDPEAQYHIYATDEGTSIESIRWADQLVGDGSCSLLERRAEDLYWQSVSNAPAPDLRDIRIMRRAIASGCGERLSPLVAIHGLLGIWPKEGKNVEHVLVDMAQRGNTAAQVLTCEIATRPNARDWTLIRFCESAAARGDADAAFRLGVFLDHRPEDHSPRAYTWQVVEPKNAPRGFKAALPWYRRAAELGHPGALARLALHHATGIGVTRDDAEAARLARLAVSQGAPEGKIVLGLLMLQGRGGEFDPQQGAALVEQAARRGNTMAQFTMATLHFQGQAVKRDFSHAHAWLALADLKTRGWPSAENSSVLLLEPPARTRFVAANTISPQTWLDGLTQAVALRRELADSGEWPLIEDFDARAAAMLE